MRITGQGGHGMGKRIGYLGFTVVVLTIISLMGVGERLSWAGDYPGKWYGWYAPPGFGFLASERAHRFSNQDIIRSWGYGANNVDEIKDLIPEPLYEIMKHPEIWGGIRINETANMPRSKWGEQQALLDAATEKYRGKVSLDEYGHIRNYMAGYPFPGSTNPQELIWNFYKRRHFGDQIVFDKGPATNVDKDGRRRYNLAAFYYLFFNGRVRTLAPRLLPNPVGMESALSFGMFDPYDVRGTTPLIYRYEEREKQDDMSIYIPSMRRIRRMSTAQRWDRTGGGSDITWDSQTTFDGKPSNYTWKYLGRKIILCVRHGIWQEPQEVKDKPMEGNIEHYYQRVNSIMLEGKPKPYMNAPVSRFILYLDPETYVSYYGVYWDNEGRLYQYYHATYIIDNEGHQRGYVDTMVDLQRRHTSMQYASTAKLGSYSGFITPDFMKMDNLKKVFGGR